MRLLISVVFSLSLGLIPAGPAMAQGDAMTGQNLAKDWCARCHDISADGPFKQTPPSFASIAVYRAADDIHWRIQFPAEHANMPRLGYFLDREALDHLVAFILSLEKPGD
ncbi:MAG: c-type cytochrome [Rhodobacter sp.]|nr:c-type cytochrome [Rhodobacter sp.]